MIGSALLSAASGVIGLGLGYADTRAAEKSRKEELDAQHLHEERLANNQNFIEYQKQKLSLNIKETYKNVRHTIYFGKWRFGWASSCKKKRPVSSPLHTSIHSIMWLFSVAYLFVFVLFAYNAQRILLTLSPESASTDWSIFFGFASRSTENPQIITVTLGGMAFLMAQPVVAALVRYTTGLTYRAIRGN